MRVSFAVIVAASVAVAAVHAASPMNFLVMGDWGGQPTYPYYTVAESKVAAAMDDKAKALSAHFSLALGDNFYDHGVTDVDDPRFKSTFEDVFSGGNLQAPAFNFYVLEGNHDHYGNASAQIAFSAKSKRWNLPNYWYNFTQTAPDGSTVEFVMIDTVLLAGQSQLPDGTDLDGDQLPGPADAALAQTQWAFIESTLAASTADYLVVAGHYPVYSVCEHGPTSQLVDQLKPLLEKYHVSAYLCGHDHCAEHIEYNNMQYHVIGAAHLCDDSTAHMSAIPAGSLKFHYGGPQSLTDDDNAGAFGTVSVSKDGLVVTHVDSSGNTLYTAPAVPPRTSV